MPYSTPELLRIGSAQNLVLDAGQSELDGGGCVFDNSAVPDHSSIPELW